MNNPKSLLELKIFEIVQLIEQRNESHKNGEMELNVRLLEDALGNIDHFQNVINKALAEDVPNKETIAVFERHMALGKAAVQRCQEQIKRLTDLDDRISRVEGDIKHIEEAENDREIQKKLIDLQIMQAQAEAARLTTEANAKAQEQASASLDGLINGLKNDG
ncbi:MAG: hypothetical protein ABJO09_00065 [Hyphomicrobiales bacterium]|uniref:hypothetical protein n=1 Tax=Roseobacteraceae TaxID=2854170 RepID=UPI0032858D9A